EAIDTLIRYISTNEQQMRYDVFRSKGYYIGSGSVEGACKDVVGKRLKQSGTRCSRAGSSATLALRVIWLNNRMEQLW
ncbi:MAG: ISKra4 family transposase, partial [Sedimentisphaerales bacterium]|nr:ISKra4 family transposase [Sedimentisphaerales bacterium]